jgi:two-component system, response regulator
MHPPLILLVEDNPDDEELTQLALREAGVEHALAVARDGAEALGYLFGPQRPASRTPGGWPALILLDLMLPKVDGHEVLRRVRADERTRSIPVVVLSTSREDLDLATSYGLGANSYVRKPVDFDRFTEVMRQLGRYWLTVNESLVGPGRRR